MKEILMLIILIGNSYQVRNDSVMVNMVNFSGYAKSEYFDGKILPGAVDTQVKKGDAPLQLSARYMLEGVDSTGKACRIYIDNKVRESTPQGYTEPSIVTDSELFASAAKGKLVGKMDNVDGQFVIRILAPTDDK